MEKPNLANPIDRDVGRAVPVLFRRGGAVGAIRFLLRGNIQGLYPVMAGIFAGPDRDHPGAVPRI